MAWNDASASPWSGRNVKRAFRTMLQPQGRGARPGDSDGPQRRRGPEAVMLDIEQPGSAAARARLAMGDSAGALEDYHSGTSMRDAVSALDYTTGRNASDVEREREGKESAARASYLDRFRRAITAHNPETLECRLRP